MKKFLNLTLIMILVIISCFGLACGKENELQFNKIQNEQIIDVNPDIEYYNFSNIKNGKHDVNIYRVAASHQMIEIPSKIDYLNDFENNFIIQSKGISKYITIYKKINHTGYLHFTKDNSTYYMNYYDKNGNSDDYFLNAAIRLFTSYEMAFAITDEQNLYDALFKQSQTFKVEEWKELMDACEKYFNFTINGISYRRFNLAKEKNTQITLNIEVSATSLPFRIKIKQRDKISYIDLEWNAVSAFFTSVTIKAPKLCYNDEVVFKCTDRTYEYVSDKSIYYFFDKTLTAEWGNI